MRATQYVKQTGGNPDYYTAYTTTNVYVEKVFGGFISTINLTNDSITDPVQFSFDGATLGGEVNAGESVTINVDQRSSVYVKATAGGDNVRIWGYVSVQSSIDVATTATGVRGAMASRTVSVTDVESAVTITAGKSFMAIQNIGNTVCYLGETGVAATDGYKLYPNSAYDFQRCAATFGFYVVCAAAATTTLGVYEW